MSSNLVESVGACVQRAPMCGTLVVGVSGGMDSVVLAHVLHSLARLQGATSSRGVETHIAHFDHALRPTSAADTRFVSDLAATWGLPFHTMRWAHGERFAGGVEATARAARYAFLAATARTVTPAGQQPCIVVAHHADDQAETLLLNLIRGSGLHGLAAMRMAATWDDGARPPVQLLRPLLRTPRSALVAYAAANALTWREDESNADTARTRNFVRHEVMPLLAQRNPAIVETLARTTHLLAQEADRLDLRDAQLLAQAQVASTRDTRLLLRCAPLQAAAWGDRCALLRAGLRSTFATRAVGLAHIEALAEPARARVEGADAHAGRDQRVRVGRAQVAAAEAVDEHVHAHTALRRGQHGLLQRQPDLVLEEDEGLDQHLAARRADRLEDGRKERFAVFQQLRRIAGQPARLHSWISAAIGAWSDRPLQGRAGNSSGSCARTLRT